MTKRLMITALVVAAVLVLAAPALAFDGYREGYVPSTGDSPVSCGSCHQGGPGIFSVWDEWITTAHSMVGEASIVEDPPGTFELTGTANAEPIADGPGCAGCHASNYDPSKHVEDAVTGFFPWTNTAGDDAFSEPFVGCSACHWGKNPGDSLLGGAMHTVPFTNMASAEICGQCHSRYSNSTVPYANNDGTTALRQYTIGTFNPLGLPTTTPPWTPAPITDFLNIPTPVAGDFQGMIYYQDPEGTLLPWSARGHEEGAQQYNEWAATWEKDGETHIEGHANALDGLITAMGGRLPFLTSCLECHSGDYRVVKQWNEEHPDDQKTLPTIANAKYGVTCQVCHDPHEPSEETSFWNEERNPQLTAPRKDLCVECHNAELGEGGVATPGSAVHHPMKEMMDGTGAIGVPQGSVSVHKGACVQCHMVPTDYDRNAVPMTGANHVFAIVEPEVAKEALSTGNISGAPRAMPQSSCSTCHAKAGDPYATYLQATLENRQEQMQTWDAQVGDELTAAAARMGHSSLEEANEAINEKDQADWTESELAFQSAFTNRQYIESEGSWGIHNWDYARTVILKALEQAKSVKSTVVNVTISSPLVTTPYGSATLKYGQSTTISGKVQLPAGADSATLLGGQVRLWFQPTGGGAFQPIQQVFLSGVAFDEYLFTVMPARSGTYKVQFLGNDTWSPVVSMQTITLNVAYRVTISRPKTNVKLNTSVKFTGTLAPLDYPADKTVQIQRKKGSSGAWKNWVTVGAGSNGNYSITKKMTKTGTYRFRAIFEGDADHLKGTSNTVKVVVKR